MFRCPPFHVNQKIVTADSMEIIPRFRWAHPFETSLLLSQNMFTSIRNHISATSGTIKERNVSSKRVSYLQITKHNGRTGVGKLSHSTISSLRPPLTSARKCINLNIGCRQCATICLGVDATPQEAQPGDFKEASTLDNLCGQFDFATVWSEVVQVGGVLGFYGYCLPTTVSQVSALKNGTTTTAVENCHCRWIWYVTIRRKIADYDFMSTGIIYWVLIAVEGMTTGWARLMVIVL